MTTCGRIEEEPYFAVAVLATAAIPQKMSLAALLLLSRSCTICLGHPQRQLLAWTMRLMKQRQGAEAL